MTGPGPGEPVPGAGEAGAGEAGSGGPGAGRKWRWRALVRRQPLDLRLVGRTLVHALVVGGVMGIVGVAFFASLELAQRVLIEGLGGLRIMRAVGERFTAPREAGEFRPWLAALLPALGGLATGLIGLAAPEVVGGGGDAIIEAYHRGGRIRRRVAPLKFAASVLALGSGGSGGREGPTMQIGGAIGSALASVVPATRRERRVLVLAGVAAGISAVFRTPLGAALLAVEMPYRDDFESDALVPAILASVTSYGVATTLLGETTLFGPLPRFPFRPAELPLFLLLAVLASLAAVTFVATFDRVRAATRRLPVPPWLRPAVGGLAMGVVATVAVKVLGPPLGAPGRGIGIFGGGYGLAQITLTGAPHLPSGWTLVGLLVLLLAVKTVATALATGSGMSVGDLAPSLVMGALAGAAFGQAMAILLPGWHLQPAAFALVGMGTFFGGIARAPLAALVIVSELAGSYDLLVPMMLASAVSVVATRRWPLYGAQERRRPRTLVNPG